MYFWKITFVQIEYYSSMKYITETIHFINFCVLFTKCFAINTCDWTSASATHRAHRCIAHAFLVPTMTTRYALLTSNDSLLPSVKTLGGGTNIINNFKISVLFYSTRVSNSLVVRRQIHNFSSHTRTSNVIINWINEMKDQTIAKFVCNFFYSN